MIFLQHRIALLEAENDGLKGAAKARLRAY